MVRQPTRNIGILAHVDAGKTTLTENLLHATGTVRYPGAVEHGSTVTDWQVQEQQRGITIGSAAITCRWRDVDITIVDTPGHVDFTIEVERSLRVLDGAVLVISGPDGVQAQTEKVWHQAYRHGIPMIGFVNKLDRPGYDDEALLQDVERRLGVAPLQLQLAAFSGDTLSLIDVLAGTATDWSLAGLVRQQRASGVDRALTAAEVAARAAAMERLIDAVASHDDDFTEAVLSGETLALPRYHAAIRRAMAARACLPLFFGVARYGAGVSAIADAVVDLLPTPDEARVPAAYDLGTGARLPDGARAFGDAAAAFVFKTEVRPREGHLAFIRVFRGEVQRNDMLTRLPADETYRPSELVRVMGGDVEPVDVLGAGAIGGLLDPIDSPAPTTGETLVSGAARATYERLDVPEPVILIALEASDPEAHVRMQAGLERLCADDPSLKLSVDGASGRSTLAGMGELHLALAVERLTHEHDLTLRTGFPAVRTRQVLAGEGEGEASAADVRLKRGQVTVTARVRPFPNGLGCVTRFDVEPKRRDQREALIAGVNAGLGLDGFGDWNLVGVEVIVSGLEIHGQDLVPVVFRDAARDAVRAAVHAAGMRDAEPWVQASVVVPDEMVGRVVGDLARRGARITGSEARGGGQVLGAEAPLAQMLGYATDLRSITAGRGIFSMEPVGYAVIDAS